MLTQYQPRNGAPQCRLPDDTLNVMFHVKHLSFSILQRKHSGDCKEQQSAGAVVISGSEEGYF